VPWDAASALLVDRRIDAGVNLDGGNSRSVDVTWSSFWSHQRGWKAERQLGAGGHGSFSDYPFSPSGLARASGLPPDVLSEGLGTIDPECAVGLVRRALAAFFARFLER